MGILESIDSWIWGPPLLILVMGTGILLTIRLGLLQVLRLPKALRLMKGAAISAASGLLAQHWLRP